MGIENGYLYVYMPESPMAKGNGCVFVHRIIMSEIIGRPLETYEHVHHIDGDRSNNNVENLMLTNRSEHARIEQEKRGNIKEENQHCLDCGIEIKCKTKNSLCRNCYTTRTRLFNPTKEELEYLVWNISTIKVAKIYGVSDKAVEKRCKILGIKKPPRGYWRKLETGKL